MQIWQCDNRYTNTYWARANNEEEYKFLIKDLFREHDVMNQFNGLKWEEKEHLFNDDYGLWHEFFESDEILDYESEEDFTNPQKYKGDVKEKPKDNEYPCVLMYCDLPEIRKIIWYKCEEVNK